MNHYLQLSSQVRASVGRSRWCARRGHQNVPETPKVRALLISIDRYGVICLMVVGRPFIFPPIFLLPYSLLLRAPLSPWSVYPSLKSHGFPAPSSPRVIRVLQAKSCGINYSSRLKTGSRPRRVCKLFKPLSPTSAFHCSKLFKFKYAMPSCRTLSLGSTHLSASGRLAPSNPVTPRYLVPPGMCLLPRYLLVYFSWILSSFCFILACAIGIGFSVANSEVVQNPAMYGKLHKPL